MLRWIRNIFGNIKISEDVQQNNDVEPKFAWCLVGNIIEDVEGKHRQILPGTKHFSPGTKVYCMRGRWGDGYEKITVIGRHRKSKRYVCLVMPAKFITNWRLQKVYRPYILNVMGNHSYGWTDSQQDKEMILNMLTWLPDRTIKNKMKLVKLTSCDIYRDGGSLEGVWLTDEGNEWAVTLKIAGDWINPNEPKEYQLFNCRLNNTHHALHIVKGSAEHKQIIGLIERWITQSSMNIDELKKEGSHDRLYDLLLSLKEGNY